MGTDHVDLLLHRYFFQGQNAVKAKLGWVLMEGSKSKEEKSLCNYICNGLTKIDKNIQNI